MAGVGTTIPATGCACSVRKLPRWDERRTDLLITQPAHDGCRRELGTIVGTNELRLRHSRIKRPKVRMTSRDVSERAASMAKHSRLC